MSTAGCKLRVGTAPAAPLPTLRRYPKASILKGGRVVFNIKANDYRLVARVQYQASVLVIRFFGTHVEYDEIDAETV
jgi:mRNA interferase HigB